jgi:hypothetical protein
MMLHRRELCALTLGAALLGGCGRGAVPSDPDESAKAKLDSCSPNPLVGLKPAIQIDAVELRMVCETLNPPGASGRMLLSSGSGCASGACAAEVEALDRRLQGWEAERPPAQPCKQYLVGMRGDRVVVSASSDAELRSFLGAIDTRSEAELLVKLHEISCDRSGEHGGRYLIASSAIAEACPSRTRDAFYSVDAQGALERLSDGAGEEGCVVGASPK